MKEAKQICPTSTLKKVNEGALIVDVRNSEEVAKVSFDVPNYLNIPISELENRLHEIPKNKEIVMVCLSGMQSLKTTYFLMNAGFENVYNMKNGIIKWASKGFPTKGDVNSLEITTCCCSNSKCC
ncbi:rhodanese-like domain-containing protein [Polaribacter sp. Z022]|uniref:rhodanese-like domain-containing protein n=1 Tax=Polaribacter sp. Z022 TaxID=2927125 RepID=UPI00201FC323|nr:rhodanese-like domain-containing protein [Polaribacter sp. Z022]MCL7753000.1 rhodanese-like domain-containing protein [Polaribacter sp. Z022]